MAAKKKIIDIIDDKGTALTLAQKVQLETERVQEAFKAGPLFQHNPNEVEPEVAVAAYQVLNTLSKMIEDRKSLYRDKLLSLAESTGAPTEKDGQEASLDSNRVLRERRRESKPNEAKLREMMSAKGVPLVECFDEVKDLRVNLTKLEYLVDIGKLNKKEVDELYKITWALKVSPSPVVKKLLVTLTDKLLGSDHKLTGDTD